MEFGLDLIGSSRDRFGAGNNRGPSRGEGEAGLLEWPGLHARLQAAYDTRRELLGHASGMSAAFGSFDRGAAARLSQASYTSYHVNPADLADGKVRPCIEADVAEPNIGAQGK